ncbi:unnamed protein product [Calypogeia fissa]
MDKGKGIEKGKGIAKPEKVEGELDDTAKSDFVCRYNPIYPNPNHLAEPKRLGKGNIFSHKRPTTEVPRKEEARQDDYEQVDNLPYTHAEFKLLSEANLNDMVLTDYSGEKATLSRKETESEFSDSTPNSSGEGSSDDEFHITFTKLRKDHPALKK